MLHMTDAQHQKVQARRDELCTQDRKQIAVSIDRIFNSIPDKESKRWSWHTGYMGSMVTQLNKGYSLSPKQLYYVAKIELEIDQAPVEQAKNDSFKDEYLSSPLMRENTKLAVEYYRKSGYWSSLIEDYTKNEENLEWSPSRTTYERAIASNRFVQRYLEEYRKAKKFNSGDMVTLRAASSQRSKTEKQESIYTPGRDVWKVYREGDLFMVLKYDEKDVEPKRGGKGLDILAVGTNEILRVREGDIKKVSKKK